ncbi:hypothetical protein TNIN_234491 [Trichonephila inaurata madagascariensis]|uniref:Uncharacterized protein n=1 Tax=Trichonephila inaurata madagascariensis TaxID=2747483 RepID=A0A8X6IH15_9ARAC|nr:hypothetical protein TNIN_234491 [Trichonephila inaurata madagascariensis]
MDELIERPEQKNVMAVEDELKWQGTVPGEARLKFALGRVTLVGRPLHYAQPKSVGEGEAVKLLITPL